MKLLCWEFTCESDAGPTGLMKRIEAFGHEGWDLVSVVFDGKRFQAFLKRARQQESQPDRATI